MGSSQKVFALLFSVLLIQSGTHAQGLKRRQQGLAHLLLGGLLTLLFSEQIGRHEEKVGAKDILQLCGHGHCQDQNALSSMLMHTHVPPLGAARTPNPLSSMRNGLGILKLPSLPSLLGGIGARIGGLTQGRNSRGFGRRLDLNPFTMGYGFGNALGLTGLHGVGNILPHNLAVHNALKSNIMNPLLPNMFAHSLTQGLPQGLGHGLTHGLGHGLPLGLGQGLTNGLGHSLTAGLGNGLTSGLGHGLTNGLGHGLTNGLGHGLSGLGPGLTSGLGHGLTSGLGNGLGLFPDFSPFLLSSLNDGLTPILPEGFSAGFPPELSHVLLRNLAKNQDAGHQRQPQQRTPENEGPSTDFDMSEIPFPDDNENEKKNVNDRRPDVSVSGGDSSEYSELQ